MYVSSSASWATSSACRLQKHILISETNFAYKIHIHDSIWGTTSAFRLFKHDWISEPAEFHEQVKSSMSECQNSWWYWWWHWWWLCEIFHIWTSKQLSQRDCPFKWRADTKTLVDTSCFNSANVGCLSENSEQIALPQLYREQPAISVGYCGLSECMKNSVSSDLWARRPGHIGYSLDFRMFQ